MQNVEDQKEKKNRKRAEKLLEECVNINSEDEETGQDTPKGCAGQESGKRYNDAEAETQLDMLDAMGPLTP